MDKIQNLYKNLIREEVESSEVQSAKEEFLREHFKTAPAATGPWRTFAFSPSFRLALVGCLALVVLVKIGTFETATHPPVTPTQTLTHKNLEVKNISAKTEAVAPQKVSDGNSIVNTDNNINNIEIKKITSQMGATMAYQKHFPDVQITVVWVLPKVLEV